MIFTHAQMMAMSAFFTVAASSASVDPVFLNHTAEKNITSAIVDSPFANRTNEKVTTIVDSPFVNRINDEVTTIASDGSDIAEHVQVMVVVPGEEPNATMNTTDLGAASAASLSGEHSTKKMPPANLAFSIVFPILGVFGIMVVWTLFKKGFCLRGGRKQKEVKDEAFNTYAPPVKMRGGCIETAEWEEDSDEETGENEDGEDVDMAGIWNDSVDDMEIEYEDESGYEPDDDSDEEDESEDESEYEYDPDVEILGSLPRTRLSTWRNATTPAALNQYARPGDYDLLYMANDPPPPPMPSLATSPARSDSSADTAVNSSWGWADHEQNLPYYQQHMDNFYPQIPPALANSLRIAEEIEREDPNYFGPYDRLMQQLQLAEYFRSQRSRLSEGREMYEDLRVMAQLEDEAIAPIREDDEWTVQEEQGDGEQEDEQDEEVRVIYNSTTTVHLRGGDLPMSVRRDIQPPALDLNRAIQAREVQHTNQAYYDAVRDLVHDIHHYLDSYSRMQEVRRADFDGLWQYFSRYHVDEIHLTRTQFERIFILYVDPAGVSTSRQAAMVEAEENEEQKGIQKACIQAYRERMESELHAFFRYISSVRCRLTVTWEQYDMLRALFRATTMPVTRDLFYCIFCRYIWDRTVDDRLHRFLRLWAENRTYLWRDFRRLRRRFDCYNKAVVSPAKFLAVFRLYVRLPLQESDEKPHLENEEMEEKKGAEEVEKDVEGVYGDVHAFLDGCDGAVRKPMWKDEDHLIRAFRRVVRPVTRDLFRSVLGIWVEDRVADVDVEASVITDERIQEAVEEEEEDEEEVVEVEV